MTAALLLLGLLAQPAPAEGRCVLGPEQPSPSEQLRPGLTAVCAYDAAGFNRRLLAMLGPGQRPLRIEAVEQAFALPRLRTSYDHGRTAHYSVILEAAPGHGGWRVLLSFEESFFPTDAWRRPRFRGSGRPALIDPRRRGDRGVGAGRPAGRLAEPVRRRQAAPAAEPPLPGLTPTSPGAP